MDYPAEAPRFVFARPLLETGTGYVDNGVVALSELRPDVWRSRTGTIGDLLLKFRRKFARGPLAAKVAVALCGEYDKVGYDSTWRLLRSGAPEAQYGAARLEPGGTDEYGRRQRRSSLTDSDLAMRLISMSEALNYAEYCGAGMERELRKNRYSNKIYFPDAKGREREQLYNDSPYATTSSSTRVTLELTSVERVNKGARVHCTLDYSTHSLPRDTPHAIVADHIYALFAANAVGVNEIPSSARSATVHMRPVCLPAVSSITLRPRRNIEGMVQSTEGWLQASFLQRYQCLTLGTTITVGVRSGGGGDASARHRYVTEEFTVIEVVSKEEDEKWGSLSIASGGGPQHGCSAVSVADRFLVEVGVKIKPESGLEAVGAKRPEEGARVQAQQGSAATKFKVPLVQRVRVASFVLGSAPTVVVRVQLWPGFVAAGEADIAPAVEVECHPLTEISEVRATLGAALDERPGGCALYLSTLLHAGEDPRDESARTALPLRVESVAVRNGPARRAAFELPLSGALETSVRAALSDASLSTRRARRRPAAAVQPYRTICVRQVLPAALRCAVTGAEPAAAAYVVGPGEGDCRTLIGLRDTSACAWVGEMVRKRQLTEYERRIVSWQFVVAHATAQLL